jgi:hypothetical protein
MALAEAQGISAMCRVRSRSGADGELNYWKRVDEPVQTLEFPEQRNMELQRQ